MYEMASFGSKVISKTQHRNETYYIDSRGQTLHYIYCLVLNQRGVEVAYLEISEGH